VAGSVFQSLMVLGKNGIPKEDDDEMIINFTHHA
jgi:hypothetical protein